MNAIYFAHSGGMTAVTNTALAGLLDAHAHASGQKAIYAGQHGMHGSLNGHFYQASALSAEQRMRLAHTPASLFGSSRVKLPDYNSDPQPYHSLFAYFDHLNIRHFVYQGGNDSQDTVCKMHAAAAAMGRELHCIGLPKTIDNDLLHTAFCPGYASAAKYLALALQEAALDLISIYPTSTKVFILETMGRDTGWLAAATAIHRHYGQPFPHIVCLPEHQPTLTTVTDRVDTVVRQHGYCVIVVAEGLGESWFPSDPNHTSTDAFGHRALGGGSAQPLAAWLQQQLGLKTHWAVCDYLQRAASHLCSHADWHASWQLGHEAYRRCQSYSAQSAPSQPHMLTIQPQKHPSIGLSTPQSADDFCQRWTIAQTAANNVANCTRFFPADWLDPLDGLTSEAAHYIERCIEGHVPAPFARGVGDYLRNPLPLISCTSA